LRSCRNGIYAGFGLPLSELCHTLPAEGFWVCLHFALLHECLFLGERLAGWKDSYGIMAHHPVCAPDARDNENAAQLSVYSELNCGARVRKNKSVATQPPS
jgi:hypothetical protein